MGTRKTFVYYLGDSPKNAVRTHWFMYEYALTDRQMASFVLCRVFAKSHCEDDTSDQVLSSCGEENVATVRHIGVQHDGTVRLFCESGVHNVSSLGHEGCKSLRIPMAPVSELNDRISDGPIGEQATSSGYMCGNSTFVDSLDAEQIMAVLEDDYIELDDLECPLPGIE